ncbi:SIR2 family protein [Paucibacter sp. PLA-PC-4]|uniref:SIR2 family protein n=1 Tax=Paucibacter sp. PLA-PC-4 TaxID=2993655 RepID=UPI00224B9AAF|nr:SIR2 family protein [Paucibacter sp. PLA-PC-4]
MRIPKDLQTAFVDRHLALGLGAGVSQASKLPEWNELVCRLAEQFPNVGRQSAEALLAAGYDATVLATILRASAPGKKEFAELVRQALYRDFPFRPVVGKETHTQFVAHIRKTNPTLHAVGTFCGVRETQRTFLPNPRVRAVLTLNLDALLEMYTRARFRKRVLRTVERAAADASSSRIHSYHLHGFLVRDFTSATRRREAVESADRLILTEQQYFDVVADANGFVNYTLLYLLREYRFLFIGLSMRDPNLRRALHLSFKERIRELLAEGETEETACARSLRHWAVMKKNTPELDSATTVLLEVIGVKPLWINEWADIPALLEALYESPGEHSWVDAA